MPDKIPWAVAESVVPLLLEKLTELVQRDLGHLGFDVSFEWPEGQVVSRQATVLVNTSRRLTVAERRVLDEWVRKNLGGEFPQGTAWDHVLDDDVI